MRCKLDINITWNLFLGALLLVLSVVMLFCGVDKCSQGDNSWATFYFIMAGVDLLIGIADLYAWAKYEN